jgi:tRNA dimethylallyltransferase
MPLPNSPETLRSAEAPKSLPPLVVILGPTAVGKTEIALQLAERLGGEIVSADSRLFYRGMDIGTAKPSQEELARVAHHLIDVAEPDQNWSLAVFQEQARRAIADIHARGRLPLLVGGTGQYIRAVIQAWDLPKVEPNPRLRSALENWASEVGEEGIHARLACLDAQAAANIDARNVRRTVRALEVILSTGRRFSEQRSHGASPYDLFLVGLMRPRQELYARIDARIDGMVAAGLVDEVQGLLTRGYPPELPTLSAIGYGEIILFLEGQISLEEAVRQIKHNTRVFVRRQANWFKPDDPNIHWFQAGKQAVDQIEAAIHQFLA